MQAAGVADAPVHQGQLIDDSNPCCWLRWPAAASRWVGWP